VCKKVKRVEGADGVDTWKRAMKKMDQDAVSKAWNRILDLNHFDEGDDLESQIRNLFDNFDSDGSNGLDYEELTIGLNSLGILINSRQIELMTRGMDIDGSGVIECDEFCKELDRRRILRLKEFEETAHKEALDTLNGMKHLLDAKSKAELAVLEGHINNNNNANNSTSSVDGGSVKDDELKGKSDSVTAENTLANSTVHQTAPQLTVSTIKSTLAPPPYSSLQATSLINNRTRSASYQRRSMSGEQSSSNEHCEEFIDSLKRLKSGTYQNEATLIETDLSKSIDDVMQECIHDMTTSYYIERFKKKSKVVSDVDMKEMMSTRDISAQQYEAFSLLLGDRIKAELFNYEVNRSKATRIQQEGRGGFMPLSSLAPPPSSSSFIGRPRTPPSTPPPQAFFKNE
jgi:hypothetical protein